jgi:quercetin dioxygenase-like cupin family protein
MTKRTHSTLASRAILRRPGEADMVDNPLGGSVAYWARSEETAGAVTVLESVVAPGEGPPLHVHVNEDEFIYVLEGRLRVRLEEAVREAPAGSFVFIPKGVPHTWKNAGDGAARFLFGFTPAASGMERFFERGAEFEADTWIAEGFGRFADDAGMELLGPPLAQSDPKR